MDTRVPVTSIPAIILQIDAANFAMCEIGAGFPITAAAPEVHS